MKDPRHVSMRYYGKPLILVIATNAVLEGKGVKPGLIITAGHKDALTSQRSQIPGSLEFWILDFGSILHRGIPKLPLKVPCDVQDDGEIVTSVDEDPLPKDIASQKSEAITNSLIYV